MKFRFLVFVCIFLVSFSINCLAMPHRIVATTGMIGDLVKAVVGDKAKVKVLMGAGIDPHLYKPTRSDIAELGNADLVFYNGLLLEGKMTDALIRVARSGKPVIAVTEQISEDKLLEPDAFAGHFDPHVWMDPDLWVLALQVVETELIRFDASNKDYYQSNSKLFIEKLDALVKYSIKSLSTVADEHKILITAHDAFNYFGKRFGFEVEGIQGLSTESEAGVRDIERIVKLLVDKKIRAVFVESTVPSRSVQALIEGASKMDHKVIIGGELFSDAMGSAGTYEGTYIGMIDHNVTSITRALGGTTPKMGMNSKLSHIK